MCSNDKRYLDVAVMNHAKVVTERDEARDIARKAVRTANRLRKERDEARAWSATWKEVAKVLRYTNNGAYKAAEYWSEDARLVGQKLNTVERQRDEARAQRDEALAELAQAKRAIVELARYTELVADYEVVDADELEAFVAKVKEMHGDGGTPPEDCWKASAEGLFAGYLDAANELSAVRERNETLREQLRFLAVGILHNAVNEDPGYRHVAELVLDGETCPIHDFTYPCPSCEIVAMEAGVNEESDSE